MGLKRRVEALDGHEQDAEANFLQWEYLLVGEVICAGSMASLKKEEPPCGSRAADLH